MPGEFRLPDPGEGIHEAEIVEIHVSEGDEVSDGDPLFSVETDKALVDIPSSFDGRIEAIAVAAGEIVEVGSLLLTYVEAPSAEPPPPPMANKGGEEGPTERAGATGAKGTRSDLPEEPPVEPASVRAARPVPASPATRALAKRLDVDLHQIEGSGPDGRIEPQDVQAATGEKEEAAPEETTVPEEEEEKPAQLPDFGRWVPIRRVDVRSVRRSIAEAMSQSWARIPHVSHHDVADISRLEDLRREIANLEEGASLTITPFLMKATVAALRKHAYFNASFDEAAGQIVLKDYYNIGIAVDTDDGLLVPVIRDVDRKPLVQLAAELEEVAQRMRAGDRGIDDLQGGTFTITNPGSIGGTSLQPIINHPEGAILGAARARRVPVVRDQPEGDGFDIEARFHLPLVVTFDHRVTDGADAARFMRTIVETLEDVPRFLLQA